MSEEAEFLKFLGGGPLPAVLSDDLHLRLGGALNDPAASALDQAVLVRQLLRRWSLRDSRNVPVELGASISDSIREISSVVGLRQRNDGLWFADPWRPSWLEVGGGVPDGAALAGTSEGVRFQSAPLWADPFFEDITGFSAYKTPGQRAACRAVMTTPEGSTIIAMLPTGSGKTEIALCLSQRGRFGVTVIVVPTVALAYDFERRFREHFAARNRRIDPSDLNFAWTASTDETTRERLKQAIQNGQQPILVTSPESITRALRNTLLNTAATGRLQGFVVDEAHLIYQWGRDFRPEFRMLADLRRDLLVKAKEGGYDRAVTLLLSATLGAPEMDDLAQLFGSPGPCSPIIANALRPEQDIWIASAADKAQREDWVEETLAHCPRPAVLYVTQPKVAREWVDRLRECGYRRISVVAGDSTSAQRAAVLEGIRARPGSVGAIDLVVATSAFGLGIDYSHIRTVIHGCLPETVDRWYQELGRSGRDGNVSTEFLLTAPGDQNEAADLGVKVLTPDVARRRWDDLWQHRKDVNGLTFVDLEGSRGVGRGDYNRKWNAQLIQGLVELAELRREQFDVEDIRELLQDDSAESAEWTAISRIDTGLGLSLFWDDQWLPWQQKESARSIESLRRIREVANLKVAACQGISDAYAPNSELRERWGNRVEFMQPFGPCGRCPSCRASGQAFIKDFPPSPEQTWVVSPSDVAELETFVAECRGVNGLALLAYETEDFALVETLASGLLALGVRHFGALPVKIKSQPGQWIFLDELPLLPSDLTPMSSFSYFSPDQPISSRWLSRRASGRPRGARTTRLYDILMVPATSCIADKRVGRDLPAMPAVTAAELLPRS
ncbi:MAG: protein DpdF [Actinomycetota bacterium]